MLPTLLFVAAFAAAAVSGSLHRRQAGPVRMLSHGLPLLLLCLSLLLSSGAVVHQLISRLIMPVGILWLLGFMSGWLLLIRGRARAAAAALGAWLLITLAGSSWVGAAMLRWLEADYGPVAADARFDAVMVLGGGTARAPWGEPELAFSGDRLRVGAMLHARAHTPLLVCSGTAAAGVDQIEARDLADEGARLLGDMGVPREVIVELPGPTNTRDEIAALAGLAAERGWQRVGLVTSAWHLRRTMRLAEKAGLRVTPIAADARGNGSPPSIMGVVPTGSGFHLVQIAWKEILGAALGR